MKGVGKLGTVGLGDGPWPNLGQDRAAYCEAAQDHASSSPVYNWFVDQGVLVGSFEANDNVIQTVSNVGSSDPYSGGGIAGTFLSRPSRRFQVKVEIAWNITGSSSSAGHCGVSVDIYLQDGSYQQKVWDITVSEDEHAVDSDEWTSDMLDVPCVCPLFIVIGMGVVAKNNESTIIATVTIVPEETP